MFNLSLSLVLELARSSCIASFVNIVGSYGVSPSLSCYELSFPLRFHFIGLNTFMDLRALDICLACGYPW